MELRLSFSAVPHLLANEHMSRFLMIVKMGSALTPSCCSSTNIREEKVAV